MWIHARWDMHQHTGTCVHACTHACTHTHAPIYACIYTGHACMLVHRDTCMCWYACTNAHMNTLASTCTYTHTHAHTTTHSHAGKHTHTHTHTHIHTHTHTCTCAHTHTHAHVHTHTHIHIHAHTHSHTHMHAYADTRVHACIHTHAQTHTHMPNQITCSLCVTFIHWKKSKSNNGNHPSHSFFFFCTCIYEPTPYGNSRKGKQIKKHTCFCEQMNCSLVAVFAIHSQSQEREIKLWDNRNLTSPVTTQSAQGSTG